MSDQSLLIFRTVGEPVAFDPRSRMWNLTEMHQAARAPKNKAPHEWLRGAQAKELIAALAAREAISNTENSRIWSEGDAPETTGNSCSLAASDAPETTGNSRSLAAGLVETREGRSGGTWAHWQLAAAYAHYLNPDFYLQWNEWAMAYAMQQRQAPPGLARPPVAAARRAGQQREIAQAIAGITLVNLPTRSLSAAVREALRQANRPLRPIELEALLTGVGVRVTHRTYVSGTLWHLYRDGFLTRDGDGRYALRTDD